MATASNFEDQISCCLCLDVFKNPRCLLCGHSFCSKCLQDYINKNHQNNDRQITCPYCMQDVQIPDSTKPVESWADQFPVNIALVDSIKERQRSKISGKGGHISFLRSVCDNLKTFKEILQSEMDDKILQLRQDVNVDVVETTEEVRRISNRLITDFADAVHKEQDRLIKEIEKSENVLNSEIEKLFTEHKHLIEENEKIIKLGEDLLQRKSEPDIKSSIPKFNKLQKTTSEFLASSLSQIQKSEFKIILRKSEEKKAMSIHIGDISTNIQTHTQLYRLPDALKHTDTINTKTQDDKENPWLFSMLVSGEDNSKTVVSDWTNRCVKCFCLKRKSLIKKYVPSSRPCGLAESRDEDGVVDVVVLLPDENKILFLDLENFKQFKTLKTKKRYWCVAMLPGNRLAVTGFDCSYTDQYLDILTDDGQLINSISADVIPSPSFLTVQDQSLIVVSKRKNVKRLFCLTPSGDVKWESRDSDRLRDLTGVTCDREGNIFVCECDRNCVVQLSRDGEVLRDILIDQDGLSKPLSVCCHGYKLYVGQDNGKVKVLTWCKK